MSDLPKLVIVEDALPDHPWDNENQEYGYCLTCGAPEVVHDGNLDRVFDWMEKAR